MRRCSAPATPSAASRAASRHSPNGACSPPPARRCQRGGRLEHGPGFVGLGPSARSTRPRWTRARAAMRTSPDGFGPADRARPGSLLPPRSHRPGTGRDRGWRSGTPRSVGSRGGREVAGGAGEMWSTASSKRCCSRASSPSIASLRTCSHGSSTGPARLDLTSAAARRSAPRRRRKWRLGRRTSQLAAWSHGRSRLAVGAHGSRRSGPGASAEVAVVRDDVGQVVGGTAPAARHRPVARASVGGVERRDWRAGARCPVEASIQPASSRASARVPWIGTVTGGVERRSAIRCAPRLSPRTIQAQPKPLEVVSAASGTCSPPRTRAASMLARSALTNARYWAWRRTAHTFGRRPAPRPRTMRCGRGDGAFRHSPASSQRLEGEGPDAVQEPVAYRS